MYFIALLLFHGKLRYSNPSMSVIMFYYPKGNKMDNKNHIIITQRVIKWIIKIISLASLENLRRPGQRVFSVHNMGTCNTI